MRYFFRPSILCFILTAIIYIAQLSPSTGIFLMMMGAIFWPVITINLGFALIAYEVILKKWPRWVIIFPILYFGGYSFVAGLSHYEFYKAKQEVIENNKNISIPYSSTENDLIISRGISEKLLLTKYGLDSVYSGSSNHKLKSHRVNVIGNRQDCKIARNIGYKGDIYTESVRSYPNKNNGSLISRLGKVVRDICVINYPEDPKNTAYIVTVEEEKYDSILLQQTAKTIIVTSPDKTEYIIRGGSAKLWKLIPRPILGCTLISSTASWKCFAGFSRKTWPQSFNTNGDTSALAKALGLRVMPEDKRFEAKRLSVSLLEIANNIKKNKQEEAYQRFEKLLLDPASYEDSLDFKILNEDKKYYSDNALNIILALKALGPNKYDRKNYKKTRVLSTAAAKIPLSKLKENNPKLISLFLYRNIDWETYSDWIWHNKELFIRLGDLGEGFHKLFHEALSASPDIGSFKYFSTPLAYAICRAGPEMSLLVGDLLLEKLDKLKNIHRRYGEKRALYIALSRLGLQNEADKIVTPRQLNPHAVAIGKNINNKSPASVCVNKKGEPTYPVDNGI